MFLLCGKACEIATSVTEPALVRAERRPSGSYFLSAPIMASRQAYASCLEQAQKGRLDITLWPERLMGVKEEALQQVFSRMDRVLEQASFGNAMQPPCSMRANTNHS